MFPKEDMRVSRMTTLSFILPVASQPLKSEGSGFLLGPYLRTGSVLGLWIPSGAVKLQKLTMNDSSLER